jgi:PAS domain S-box-containing protein
MSAAQRHLDPKRQLLAFILTLGSLSVLLFAGLFFALGMTFPAVFQLSWVTIPLAALGVVRYGRLGVEQVVLFMINVVLAVVVVLTCSMGGVVPSGGFIAWIAICPISGLVFLEGAARTFAITESVVVLALLAGLDPSVANPDPLPEKLHGLFIAINLLTSGTVIIGTLLHFQTRLRLEEQSLRESEERYRTTLDNSLSIVALKDADGRYLLVNRRFEEVFGVRREDVIGRTAAEALPEGLASALAACDAEAAGRDAPLETDDRLPVGTGSRDFLSVRFRLPSGPGVLCWIALDVTVRKRLQEEVLTTRKLESLGTLAGGIAHDFNNLLMASAGYVALARQSLSPGDLPEVRLGEAEKAMERATQLTQQLLTFARGGAPVRSVSSIGETVRESARFVLHGTQVHGEFDIPDGLPAVEADLGQISRLVQNLVLNAVQAMPGGGTVSVRCDDWIGDGRTTGLDAGRRFVRIIVRDEGSGIPEADRQRIFDPYFTTKAGGSGLGLTTCHSIARSHGGRILLESEVGRGSTFTVLLPSSEKPVPRPAARDTTRRRVMGGRALVMDDEPAVLEVMAQMLKSLGWTVTTSSEGGEAVERYRAAMTGGTPFDVAVLDLTIRGGLGGVETVARLAAEDPDVRAVAASGYTDDPVLANPQLYGFRGVLRKPFRLEDMDAVISGVARRSAPSSP